MIFKIFGYEEDFIFNDDKSAIIYIENAKQYSRIAMLLQSQDRTNEVLFLERSKRILLKDILLVTDLFNFQINDRKILNKLYQFLETEIKSDLAEYCNIQKCFNEINNLLLTHYIDCNIEIEYNEEVDLKEYLKGVKLQIVQGDSTDIFQKILSIIEVVNELSLYKFIVFIGVLSYFDNSQIDELTKQISYYNLPILFIERYGSSKTTFSNIYRIDMDFICL
ncbi:type II-A CRISPR-associated protein Csn2 [Tannockella kyphosi]|uniref:type II-A CRISPR-associated protein Csn2 n=1 Tax=Tannockella kyphosi TaxID=2899121 RepID=UPI002011F030|nr:type II-A CRISPR-associated protein Csn2 [Tannockella kyphosi]